MNGDVLRAIGYKEPLSAIFEMWEGSCCFDYTTNQTYVQSIFDFQFCASVWTKHKYQVNYPALKDGASSFIGSSVNRGFASSATSNIASTGSTGDSRRYVTLSMLL